MRSQLQQLSNNSFTTTQVASDCINKLHSTDKKTDKKHASRVITGINGLAAGLIATLALTAPNAFAASIGPAKAVNLLQESNVLHVDFQPDAAKSGLPDCARRAYIKLDTEAGRIRASLAMMAFAADKDILIHIDDGLTSCQWSSSVPSNWLRVIR